MPTLPPGEEFLVKRQIELGHATRGESSPELAQSSSRGAEFAPAHLPDKPRLDKDREALEPSVLLAGVDWDEPSDSESRGPSTEGSSIDLALPAAAEAESAARRPEPAAEVLERETQPPARRHAARRRWAFWGLTGFVAVLAAAGSYRYSQGGFDAEWVLSAQPKTWIAKPEREVGVETAAEPSSGESSRGGIPAVGSAPRAAMALETRTPRGVAKSETTASSSPQRDPSGMPWIDGSESSSEICKPADTLGHPPDAAASQRAVMTDEKGRRLLVHGDLTAALGAFCEAVALDPMRPSIVLALAHSALIARDAESAALWAEHVLASDSSNLQARELLGDALIRAGEVEAARDQWFKAHRITGPSESVVAGLFRDALTQARSSLKQSNYARAERYYRRAAGLDEKSADASTGVAQALLLQGYPKAAHRWIQRSLFLGANDSQTLLVAGDTEAQLGNEADARDLWKLALETDRNNFSARRRLNELK